MHWLLIGYMFLFIHRPFEVWPWLGDLHVERVYMILTLAVWAVYPKKKWLPNPQHWAYAAFAVAVAAAWALSPWAAIGQPKVEDWFKIVVFYGLLVTTVQDEKGLKRLVLGFVAIMGVYMLHSLREYAGGKYTYRMGISRMLGVDTTLGDPNSFGASIVLALPFVPLLWRTGLGGRWMKLILAAYTLLSGTCILLTGSRSSLLGLLVWFAVLILGHRKRFLWLLLFAAAAPLAFVALPPSLQNRFETIINPDVGPENAKTSGEGRLQGLQMGAEQFVKNPLSGVGPGAWRPATGSDVEAHSLYGQVIGETGLLGTLPFLAIVGLFAWNCWQARRTRTENPAWRRHLVCQMPSAVAVGLFLLLFMGFFGHNLFRFTWLWYGGFLIIARHCLAVRTTSLEETGALPDTAVLPPQAVEEEPMTEVIEDEQDALPDGWTAHPGHPGHIMR